MKALIVVAFAVALGLGYLAAKPEITVRKLEEMSRRIDWEEWLEEATAGVDAGNPFWEVAYGNMLLFGSDEMSDVDGLPIAADPRRARELMESAAGKGLTVGLVTAWWSTGRDDEALLGKATSLGDPYAVETTLLHLVDTAPCSPEGLAVIPSGLPSREALARNHEQLVALHATYERPAAYWFEEDVEARERRYARVDDWLGRVEAGIACSAGGAATEAEAG